MALLNLGPGSHVGDSVIRVATEEGVDLLHETAGADEYDHWPRSRVTENVGKLKVMSIVRVIGTLGHAFVLSLLRPSVTPRGGVG